MISIRSILLGVVAAVIAYQYAPLAPYLQVEEGDAIVVTGSHTGIGKHAALTLAQEGYTVFACVRKEQHGKELIETAKQLDINPTNIKPILLDVTNNEQIAAAVETVTKFVGDSGLYGLFNNAGIGAETNSVEDAPLSDYRRVFEVNYFGLLETTKAFLPLIRKRKGRILSNTSIAGFMSGPFYSPYTSSKFAVEALSDSLRRELYPFGVHVSVLEPGFVKTPILSMFANNIKTFDINRSIYSKTVDKAMRQGAKLATDAASPRVTSEAVVDAFRSTNPKTRYIVGYLSKPSRFIASLPDKWADALMRANEGANLITNDEVEMLSTQSGDDHFEF